MHLNQSVQKYLLSLASIVAISVFIVQTPGLLLLLSDMVSPGDFSERLRSWGRVGANKEILLTVVLIGAGMASLALSTISRNFRAISVVIRVGASVFVAVMLISFLMTIQQARFFNEKQHDGLMLQTVAYERLAIRQMRSPSGIAETQKLILDRPPKSFEDLHQTVSEEFVNHRSELKESWRGLDESALRAAYTMNVVSRLWAYGNESNPDRVGCALQNEQTGFKPRAFDGLESFIRSPIGCCSDYAFTLKKLFDVLKIENRLVEIPGHVFNEAKIGGRWWVFDATSNMAIPHAWSSVMAELPPSKIKVFSFPHWNLRPSAGRDYRSKVGVFRLYFLNLVSLGGLKDFHYQSEIPAGIFPELPSSF